MNLSRPFGKTALGVIGMLLLTVSGFLVLDVLSDAGVTKGGNGEGLPGAAESLGVTRPGEDVVSPAVLIQATAVRPLEETARATHPPSTVTPVATLPSPSTARPVSPDLPGGNPTPAGQPLPEESPTSGTAVTDWQRVQIPEVGVAFEVPAGWPRLGVAWAWSADGESAPHVGFKWSEGRSPSEMVPTPSVVTAVKPVNLGWVEGQSFQVEVMAAGAVVAVEKHVVFRIDSDLSGDFYVTGRSTADLTALDPILMHVLSSITYQTVPDGPVEVSVGFLTALLEDSTGDRAASFLSTRLQDESPLSLLRIEGMFSSFSVSWSAVADARIQVLATLRYPGERVEQRVLYLIEQDGAWRIDEVATAS
jgi:hypothetical protein